MATLAERLTAKNKELTEQMPDAVLDQLEQGVQKIKEMGVQARALKEGDPMPSFELPEASGETVRSEELLAKGPLALHFYRGVW